MRKTLVLLLIFFSIFSEAIYAQVIKPPIWSYEALPAQIKSGDVTELIFRAKIPSGWYIYSSDVDPNLGPQPTSFKFKKNSSYQLLGGIRPVGAKKKYSDIWEGEYSYFMNVAEFRQKVKILSSDVKIEGTYEYQMCSDVTGQCVPFDDVFKFGPDVLKVKKDEVADTLRKNTETSDTTVVADTSKKQ